MSPELRSVSVLYMRCRRMYVSARLWSLRQNSRIENIFIKCRNRPVYSQREGSIV